VVAVSFAGFSEIFIITGNNHYTITLPDVELCFKSCCHISNPKGNFYY